MTSIKVILVPFSITFQKNFRAAFLQKTSRELFLKNKIMFDLIDFKLTVNKPAFTCSKSTMKTQETFVKPIQSWQKRHQNHAIDVRLLSLLLTLNRFQTFFWCFHCWLWTSKWKKTERLHCSKQLRRRWNDVIDVVPVPLLLTLTDVATLLHCFLLLNLKIILFPGYVGGVFRTP